MFFLNCLIIFLIFFQEVNAQSKSGKIIVYTNQDLKSWADAEAFCQSTHGTHLATITSVDDMTFIKTFKSQNIWIGLNDIAIESGNDRTKWVWASGKPFDTSLMFWNIYEPGGGSGENCIAVESPSGRNWADFPCSFTQHFACDLLESTKAPTKHPKSNPTTANPTSNPTTAKPTLSPATSIPTTPFPTTTPTTASPTLEDITNIIVLPNTMSGNWEEAREICKNLYGTDLATIKTLSDQNYLDSFPGTYWIGLNDIAVESNNDPTKWVWTSGESLNTQMMFWNSGEPGGGSDENCVASEPGAGRRWADYPCFFSNNIACNSPYNSCSQLTKKNTCNKSSFCAWKTFKKQSSCNPFVCTELSKKKCKKEKSKCVWSSEVSACFHAITKPN